MLGVETMSLWWVWSQGCAWGPFAEGVMHQEGSSFLGAEGLETHSSDPSAWYPNLVTIPTWGWREEHMR